MERIIPYFFKIMLFKSKLYKFVKNNYNIFKINDLTSLINYLTVNYNIDFYLYNDTSTILDLKSYGTVNCLNGLYLAENKNKKIVLLNDVNLLFSGISNLLENFNIKVPANKMSIHNIELNNKIEIGLIKYSSYIQKEGVNQYLLNYPIIVDKYIKDDVLYYLKDRDKFKINRIRFFLLKNSRIIITVQLLLENNDHVNCDENGFYCLGIHMQTLHFNDSNIDLFLSSIKMMNIDYSYDKKIKDYNGRKYVQVKRKINRY